MSASSSGRRTGTGSAPTSGGAPAGSTAAPPSARKPVRGAIFTGPPPRRERSERRGGENSPAALGQQLAGAERVDRDADHRLAEPAAHLRDALGVVEVRRCLDAGARPQRRVAG